MNELHAEIPKAEKYRLAWAALQGTSCDNVAHAKCWLTYRAFDGEITFDDWKKHIQPIKVPNGSVQENERWAVSISTATFYLSVMRNDRQLMMQAADQVMAANLHLWPGVILNWCRVRTILAKEALLNGKKDTCRDMITQTWKLWQSAMANFEPAAHPVRFIEAVEDMRALHTLMIMGQEVGIIPSGLFNQNWLNIHETNINQSGLPWVQCMHHLENSKVALQSPKAAAPLRRADLGILVPQDGIVAELGVARGDFSAALLRQHAHIGNLYAIDKWNDERHPASEEAIARQNLSDPRAVVLRKSFEEAAKCTDLGRVKFDLIYIDGYAHTGQDSGATLAQWWPKLKSGGIFAGHDYDPAWPLTIDAVNNFAAKNNLIINTILEKPFNSWWVKKP